MAPREVVVMAKVKRNGPCPCGSGQKAKRCCPAPTQILEARIIPPELMTDLLLELSDTSKIEMHALFEQLIYLPELDLSLQVPLPVIRTPDIDRAVRALMDDDTDEFDSALAQVVPIVDTVCNRLLLARAVVILRDAGKIPRKLAALAVLELDREASTFFMSSVAESLSLLAGDRRTPSGLLVAAH